MIPSLPARKTYFTLDEVSQWVDIAPEALHFWLSAQKPKKIAGASILLSPQKKASVSATKRRYHRREVIWLCKMKPTIETMAHTMLGKHIDTGSLRQELEQLLTLLSS